MDMNLRLVPSTDINLLSKLYKELMEDERSDAALTDTQISEAMAGFLDNDEKAYVAFDNGQIVGYALVILSRTPFYLHHFYICRDHRRKGYGTAFFSLLLKELQTTRMDLDVLVWNTRGQAFWKSLGFKPRCIIMRYNNDND